MSDSRFIHSGFAHCRLASLAGLIALTAGGCSDDSGSDSACGNGLLEGYESCDDGNSDPNDGCSASCTVEDGWTCPGNVCANIDECTEGTDDCDPNAACEDTVGGFTCTCAAGYYGTGDWCTILPGCGNGVVEANETCDDSNVVNGDGCSSTCQIEPTLICGNGIQEQDEGCDDGNATTGDGCTPTCTVESGWTCPDNVCANIDECAEGTDDCDPNATCEDTVGSFACTCAEGFSGDGQSCVLDPATYVADVSSRPIQISISGVGVFDIHTMGRLATEIVFVSQPGTGNRVERIPTGWQNHDLVMRNISAQSGSSLSNLVTWAGSTTPRTATIRLDGLGTELLDLTLSSAVPVSADTTQSAGQMAELVVSIGSIDLPTDGYTSPLPPMSAPGNSTAVELTGIFYSPVLLPTDIDESSPGTADPIRVGNLGAFQPPGYGDASALINCMREQIQYFEIYGDVLRISISQIHLDSNLQETDRVNCYEAFPSLLYYFNPAKTYGSTFLMDCEITLEWCEQA